MLYYLLYNIDIFSDYLFLLDVAVFFVVFFWKSKKSLTNAIKLIVKFHNETGSVELS